jgi:hypothetical protein
MARNVPSTNPLQRGLIFLGVAAFVGVMAAANRPSPQAQAEAKRVEAQEAVHAAQIKRDAEARLERLPNKTPNGVLIDDKKQFFLMEKDPPSLLSATDMAVKMARANGLRCDTVSYLQSWLTREGFTLGCNQFRYKYYLEDKGRGYEIKIPD